MGLALLLRRSGPPRVTIVSNAPSRPADPPQHHESLRVGGLRDRLVDALYLAGVAAVVVGSWLILAFLALVALELWRPVGLPSFALIAVVVVTGLLLGTVLLVHGGLWVSRLTWWLAWAGQRAETAARPRMSSNMLHQLGYATTLLTLGGAGLAVGALLAAVLTILIVSPALVAKDIYPVLGPVVIRNQELAWFAAVLGAVTATGTLWQLGTLGGWHRRYTQSALADPADVMGRQLADSQASRVRLNRRFDDERARIERDLHDGVQPQLLRASMSLALALEALPADEPARTEVGDARDQIDQARNDLRRFVRGLHPQTLTDRGVTAALQDTFETTQPPVTIAGNLGPRPDPSTESTLYFAISELVTNALKHAGADTVTVWLSRDGRTVQAAVIDDGHGGARLTVGGGLIGVQDRLDIADGTLQIDSPSGGPTTVTLTMEEARA